MGSSPIPATDRVTLVVFCAVGASVSLPYGEVVGAGGPVRSHPAVMNSGPHLGKGGSSSVWGSLASRGKVGRLGPQAP